LGTFKVVDTPAPEIRKPGEKGEMLHESPEAKRGTKPRKGEVLKRNMVKQTKWG